MKFGQSFEYHKIPEWYNMYLNYAGLKKCIETFKESRKKGELVKLPGFYMLTKERLLVQLDAFNDVPFPTRRATESAEPEMDIEIQQRLKSIASEKESAEDEAKEDAALNE
jgi:hypothetical protein